MARRRVVYCLGYSKRDKKSFLHLLQYYGITTLVDVRRFPRSRIPHFNRDVLMKTVRRMSVQYVDLGHLLGGFRKPSYEEYTKTGEFSRGVNQLEMKARKAATAFLCVERDARWCHRRFIAKALAARGWSVIDIKDVGQHDELGL